MSEQLVYGAIGATIGFFVGGPTGAQWGFAIGSAVGAQAAAPDQVGPRLNDLNAAIGSYGQPIPQVWGGDRVACPVIWAAPLKEVESSSSGKGGPTITSYAYFGNFAVAIAEGPVGALRKIWLDAKLVYDASATADTGAQAASTLFAEYFTLHPGNETQMPDPTIEAFEGVGNVEPYRGTAYMVFTDLPLAEYGNRIPQVRVEVAPSSATATAIYADPLRVPAWRINPLTGMPEPAPQDPASPSPGPGEYTVVKPSNVLTPFTSLSAALAAALANGNNLGSQLGNPSADQYLGYYTSTNGLPSFFGGGATLVDDPEDVYLIFGTVVPDIITDAAYLPTPYHVGCTTCFRSGLGPYDTRVTISKGAWEADYIGLVSMSPFAGSNFINNCFEVWPGYDPMPQAYGARFNIIRMRRVSRCDSLRCYPGTPDDYPDGLAQAPGNALLCINTAGEASPNGAFTEVTGSPVYKQLNKDIWSGTLLNRALLVPAQGPVLHQSDPNYNNEAFWQAAYDAALFKPPGSYYAAANSDTNWPVIVSSVCQLESEYSVATEGSVALADIVSDLCQQAGLTTGQIDVTDLAGITVPGYTRTRVMSVRAALEPLRQAYWFDAVEVDGKLVFVRRGGAVVATIPADDLAAGLNQAQEVGVSTQRGQLSELPASVGVAYKGRGADFQTLTQQSRRRVGGSRQQVMVELPMVLPDQHAAEVADVLLYEAWTQRNQRTLSLPPAYKRLVPTDVIQVSDGEFTYRLRIMEKGEDQGLVQLTCVDDYVGHYAPNAAFGSAANGGATLEFAGPARLLALDLPLLQDADDSPGFYVASSVYGTRYRTTRVLRRFGTGDWEGLLDLDTEAVIGRCESALPAWTGGVMVDEINTLTVRVLRGTLASITRAELLNGGNACAIGGGELLQFQRATPLGDNLWALTGLLRGRLGTEHAWGSHTVGSDFVLLSSASLRRVADSAANRDRASTVAGVPLGSSVDQAYAVAFTNTDEALRPRAPIHMTAVVDPVEPGQWLVRWTRRARQAAPLRDYIGTALGEAEERYVLDVVRSGAVIRSLSVTTPSASIAALSGDTLRVRQYSATLGPGRPATLIVP